MSDSEIITKYLIREFTNDHPVIYLYVCGNVRSPKRAIEKVISEITPIFFPAMNKNSINSIVKTFLDNKKKQYINGEIKVKALY